MSDLITVGAAGIRAKLLESSELADIVLDGSSGQHKVFLYAAPGNMDVPYILMVHIWGGDKNETPRETFDMLWRVSAVVSDVPDGEAIAALMREQLHRQNIPYPDGWSDWAGTTYTGPYMNMKDLQNEQFWEVGAYVRLRGNKQI